MINAGCAGPPAYRYVNHVLIPPAVKQAGLTQRTVTIPIAAKCGVSEDGIQFARGVFRSGDSRAGKTGGSSGGMASTMG